MLLKAGRTSLQEQLYILVLEAVNRKFSSFRLAGTNRSNAIRGLRGYGSGRAAGIRAIGFFVEG